MKDKNLQFNYLIINTIFTIIYFILIVMIESKLVINDGVSIQSVIYLLNTNLTFNALLKIGVIFLFFNSIFAYKNKALLISNFLLVITAFLYFKNFMIYESGVKIGHILPYLNRFAELIQLLCTLIIIQFFVNLIGDYKKIKTNIKELFNKNLEISNKRLLIFYSVIFVAVLIAYKIYLLTNN